MSVDDIKAAYSAAQGEATLQGDAEIAAILARTTGFMPADVVEASVLAALLQADAIMLADAYDAAEAEEEARASSTGA